MSKFGVGGVTDHGALTGLSDDDHTQYPLLLGRSGGQTIIGGTGSGDDLTLQSTSNATKGNIILDGSLTYKYNALASSITLSGTHHVVGIDASSTNRTETLPSASSASGQVFRFILTGHSGSNTGTISRAGSDTILLPEDNSATSIVLYVKGDAITIMSDGSQWLVLNDDRIRHTAKMTREAAQSIPHGTVTKVAVDTTVFDIGGIADSTTNDRFDIRRKGKYLVSSRAYFGPLASSASYQADVLTYVNGTLTEFIIIPRNIATDSMAAMSHVLDLNAGDYVEFNVYQTNAGSSAQNTDTNAAYLPAITITEIK